MTLLDVNMPRMSGFEALQRIRESGVAFDVGTEIPRAVDTIAADQAVTTALDRRLDQGSNLFDQVGDAIGRDEPACARVVERVN